MTSRATFRQALVPAAALLLAALPKLALANHSFGGVRVHAGAASPVHEILAAADLTGDTVPDAAWLTGTDLRVMPSLGGGVFGLQALYPTGLTAAGPRVAFGDVTGDSRLDAVVGPTAGGLAASVLRNDGTGAFAATLLVLPRASGRLPFLADADNDLDLDIYLVDQGLTLFENLGGVFALAWDQQGSVAQERSGIALGDLDGDGRTDLAARALDGSHQGLDLAFIGPDPIGGGPSVVQVVPVDPGLEPGAVVGLADLDGDGDLDVIAHGRLRSSGAAATVVIANLGNRSFVALAPVPSYDRTGSASTEILARDLDGDGLPEVVISCADAACRSLVLHQAVAGGLLMAGDLLPVLDAADRLLAVDIDCDGDLDLLGGATRLIVVYNRGGLVFEDETYLPIPARDLALADFDGDTQFDVIGIGSTDVRSAPGSGCVNAGDPVCTTPLPRADAGGDRTECVTPGVTHDVLLSSVASVPGVPSNPLLRHCWQTDVGWFVESGGPKHCSGSTEATLRLLPAMTRTVATVTLGVAGAAGCLDEDTISIVAETEPVVALVTRGPLVGCGSVTADLSAIGIDPFSSLGLVTLSWDFDVLVDSSSDGDPDNDVDAQRVAVSGHVAVVSANYTTAGTHRARVTARGEGSACEVTAELDITVGSLPVVSSIGGGALACPGTVLNFNASASSLGGGPAPLIFWDFDTSLDTDGNGNAADDPQATGTAVQWTYATGGVRTVRATAINALGCRAFSEKVVTTHVAPEASFLATSPACNSPVVTFTDTSTGMGQLFSNWDFGDGSPVVLGARITHVYSRPGVYLVTQTVEDTNRCTGQSSRAVVIADVALDVPTVVLLDGQPGTGTLGNANGFPEPGETVALIVSVRNSGADSAAEVTAAVSVTSPQAGVTVQNGVAPLPVIPPGATRESLAPQLLLALSPSLPCGTLVDLRLTATGLGNASCATTVQRRYTLGVPELALSGTDRRVTQTPGRSERPHSATGGGVHVTVFQDSLTNPRQVRVARHVPTGSLIEPPTPFSDTTINADAPRIAWAEEAGVFGVAWRETPGAGTRIAFARLTLGGQRLGDIIRLGTGAAAGEPDVTWNGNHFVIAWPEPGTVLAQAVSAAGVIVSPSRAAVALADIGVAQFDGIALASAPGSYALAARRSAGGGATAIVRTFASGEPTTTLVAAGTADVGATGPSRLALAPLGTDYALVRDDSAGFVRSAVVMAAGGVGLEDVVGAGSAPAVSSGPGLGIITWEAGEEILARGIGSSGRVHASALAVSGGVGASVGPAVTVGPDGTALVAWADRRIPHADDTEIYVGIVVVGNLRECTLTVLGDIAPQPGGDGRVDISDVVLALRVAVGLTTLDAESLARGDVAPGLRVGSIFFVTGNGVMDIGDVVILLQAATGLVTLSP